MVLQLHQLMPSILTCLIAKRIGPSPGGPGQGKTKGALPAQPMAGAHWALRDLAASLITLVCSRYGPYFSFRVDPVSFPFCNRSFFCRKEDSELHYRLCCMSVQCCPF